ncbi:MAG: YbjN domain-containing protein [Gemmatimonadales bacterium]
MRRLLLVLFALCIMLPAAARAQDILAEVSPKKMGKILTSMGLEVQETKTTSDGKNPVIKFDLAGYGVVLFLAKDLSDAQLFVGFRGQQIPPEKMNEWNRAHRFSRAYRDDDGDSVLEADIDFTGGVTEANIKAWVKIFRNSTGEYARFLHSTSVSQSN